MSSMTFTNGAHSRLFTDAPVDVGATQTLTIDIDDSPPLSPTQPAPPPASPCLVTGPSLAAQAPPGQSSASTDHLHESELPRTAGDSAVNGVLVNGGTSTTDDVLVVKCGQCSTLNIISLAKDCWYVIFRGLGVGVQRDIEVVEHMTKGVQHVLYKKYTTRASAEDVFKQAKKRGFVQYLFR